MNNLTTKLFKKMHYIGCETGHYEEDCSTKCNHCNNNATCGIHNGECDDNGCASSGYQPPLCKGKPVP